MLITFKTLQQQTFKIEIDETVKVKALKEKIAQEKGLPVDGQKLIYAGKILDDEKLISEFNIDPIKNFVVIMVVKPKSKPPEKPKETETSTSRSSTSTETASSDKESSETASSANVSEANLEATTSTSTESTTTTTPALASQNTTEIAESTLLTGTALESSITELMSLGFSREQVMRALNRSFHNADRAAEYLLSDNIPDLPDDTEDVSTAVTDTPSSNPSAGSGDLSFLRSLPQFQLMRNQVREHPESLPQLLQEIGRSNPQLLSMISQQQEAFIALLNEPDPNEGDESSPLESGAQGGGDGSRSMQIQVTPDEKAAIDRLVAMGFVEGDALQAFFACEKDEQLAIDFLLKD